MKRYLIIALLFLFTSPAFAATTVMQSSVTTYCGGQYTAPIKFAPISAASSGDNTLVAAVAGKKIRVIFYTMIAAAAVDVRFESGAGGTALTGVMNLPAAGNGAAPSCGIYGCFETAAGALLNLELSGAVSVGGHLTYVECE